MPDFPAAGAESWLASYPDLDRWARRIFADFRDTPIVDPSRDVVAAVVQRLKELTPEESTAPP